jgi:hypothetical protein
MAKMHKKKERVVVVVVIAKYSKYKIIKYNFAK